MVNWVAFAAQPDANGRGDLYITGVNGIGLRQITDTPDTSEGRPSWSPDGTEIAYHGKLHTVPAPNWDIFAIRIFTPAPTAIREPRALAVGSGEQLGSS